MVVQLLIVNTNYSNVFVIRDEMWYTYKDTTVNGFIYSENKCGFVCIFRVNDTSLDYRCTNYACHFREYRYPNKNEIVRSNMSIDMIIAYEQQQHYLQRLQINLLFSLFNVNMW